MDGGEADLEGRSVAARALWPWAVFTAALFGALALYFVYPPR
ncbi:MAG TPA: hypothetical protein VJT67_12270 [Longimicrobiaceae bacterium]|nr:hypothetical protein [Longimicrobiaceae bacterium]